MSQQEKIKEALRRLLDNGPMVRTGIVTAVDAGKWTCTVKCADGMELKNVFLKLYSETEKGLVIVPKVNTDVRILNIGEPYWMVISVEQADKIYADADTEIIFNGGDNGGIPVADKIDDNFKAIKDYLDKLVYAISLGITGVGIGTAANGSSGASTFNQQILNEKIMFKNIENTKIKH